MLKRYFVEPFTIARLKQGPAGAHLDSFARYLRAAGYSRLIVRAYLREAAHFGQWLHRRGRPIRTWRNEDVPSFATHLSHCKCYRVNDGKFPHAKTAAMRFLEHLQRIGVLPSRRKRKDPILLTRFLSWMRQHRGVSEPTLDSYRYYLTHFVRTIHSCVSLINARMLRRYVAEDGPRHGRTGHQYIARALRMFVRYLVTTNQAPAELDGVLPSFRRWRLAPLPRYLSAREIDRMIRSWDLATPLGSRNRAILLLLSRLGLRAGDVAGLRLSNIDWRAGSLRLAGKSRIEARLPLPQQVGDAILLYVKEFRPLVNSDALFITVVAPVVPIKSGGVQQVARRSMERAGITPASGSHLLRHSAATEMLRHGVPLDDIGSVLRHRSMDTTALYAKVDLGLLRQVVQPWPEVQPC
jgi:site-specific recombinase XerD